MMGDELVGFVCLRVLRSMFSIAYCYFLATIKSVGNLLVTGRPVMGTDLLLGAVKMIRCLEHVWMF